MQKSYIERLNNLAENLQNLKNEVESLVEEAVVTQNTDKIDENSIDKCYCCGNDTRCHREACPYLDSIYKCYCCGGDGCHKDTCPWLENWTENDPKNASRLKFTCPISHDVFPYFTIKHTNDCNFKFSYAISPTNSLYCCKTGDLL